MPLADPGAIADVIAGGLVDPDWGNGVRDRILHHFASAAARDAAIVSPTEGMMAWLADVDQFVIYNGVAWRAPWNMPWGAVGYAQATTPQTGIAAVDVDLTSLTVTWTAVANRKYRALAYCHFVCNTGNTRPVLKIKTSGGTQLGQMVYQELTATHHHTMQVSHYDTSVAAGSTTWKVAATTNSNTIDTVQSSTEPAFLLIEDVGPSGVAA